MGEESLNNPQTPQQHDFKDSSDITDNHRPRARDDSGTLVSVRDEISATKDAHQHGLSMQCVQQPQPPLSTQDLSRPGYRIDGGSAESTHGDSQVQCSTGTNLGAAVDQTSGSINYGGNAQTPNATEIPPEDRTEDRGCTTSRASTEFPDSQEVLDRYCRRQSGAGPRTQSQNQTQNHPLEVIDLTLSDDNDVRSRPDGTNSKKRSHSDDDDPSQRQRRKRTQKPVSRRSKRLERVLAAYLPVTLMVTIEGSIVEFKWNEPLGRWHNSRSCQHWDVLELLENLVYVQVAKDHSRAHLIKNGSQWKGSSITAGTVHFEHAEIRRMISGHRMGKPVRLA